YQNSIISSINENFSKLCNSDDVSALKENLIYLQNNLDNSSVEFKSYTKLNESYYKSITQSLEKFDAKLSSFEAINKKLDLFENNSTLLFNNFLDLNKEVEKLKNIVIPVSENLELLQSDFNELRDTILTSYSAKNDNSVPSDTSEINSINERLNIICENIQKVMDVISTITIEPLD
ncbi:DNRLRE domain-containing protein, partial [Clostridium butyricum]